MSKKNSKWITFSLIKVVSSRTKCVSNIMVPTPTECVLNPTKCALNRTEFVPNGTKCGPNRTKYVSGAGCSLDYFQLKMLATKINFEKMIICFAEENAQ